MNKCWHLNIYLQDSCSIKGLESKKSLYVLAFYVLSAIEIACSVELSMNKIYNLGLGSGHTYSFSSHCETPPFTVLPAKSDSDVMFVYIVIRDLSYNR